MVPDWGRAGSRPHGPLAVFAEGRTDIGGNEAYANRPSGADIDGSRLDQAPARDATEIGLSLPRIPCAASVPYRCAPEREFGTHGFGAAGGPRRCVGTRQSWRGCTGGDLEDAHVEQLQTDRPLVLGVAPNVLGHRLGGGE